MNEQIERRPIGNRLRFDVFNRDKFTCQYCGKQSCAEVVLEVDHVVPVVEGGTNDIQNLVTACFECNRGKSTKRIDPSSVETMPTFEYMEQHRVQVEAFLEYTKFLRESEDKLVLQIWNAFGYGAAYSFSGGDRMDSGIRALIRQLGFEETLHAARIAHSQKSGSMLDVYKYFCGVCRNKMRGENDERN